MYLTPGGGNASTGREDGGHGRHVSERYVVVQREAILVQDSAQQQPSRLRALVLAIAWGLIVLACARPHHVGNEISLPLSGRDLMLAIDISPSMKQRDMLINNVESTRLMAVKSVVGDFIARREGDRIGLILFGSQPYVQAPLTFDLKTVETLLNEAFLGMASGEGKEARPLATKKHFCTKSCSIRCGSLRISEIF